MNMSKTRTVHVVGWAVLAATALGLGTFVVQPRFAAANRINAEVAAVQQTNGNLANLITTLTARTRDIRAEYARAAAIEAKFPPTAAQADLFTEVQNAASAAGIPAQNVAALTPGVPQPLSTGGGAGLPGARVAGGVAVMNVGLTVTGSYTQLVAFLHNVENMPRAYLMQTVSLGSGSTGSVYTLTVAGQMFVMSPPPPPTVPTPAG